MARGVKLGKETARRLIAGKKDPYRESGRVPTNRPDVSPIIFRNDSGEEVPAYAVMKVTGAEEENDRYIVVIDKPDSTGGPFLFNGSAAVANGDRGSAQHGPVVRAKYSGTPVVGDTFGPLSDWVCVATGDPALVMYDAIDTGLAFGSINVAPANLVFPVTLSQTGGSDGDATTAASWTYTVTDAISGDSLGTGVSPVTSPHVWKRWAAGKVTAATAGLAYYNSSDALVLTWINEVLVVESC